MCISILRDDNVTIHASPKFCKTFGNFMIRAPMTLSSLSRRYSNWTDFILLHHSSKFAQLATPSWILTEKRLARETRRRWWRGTAWSSGSRCSRRTSGGPRRGQTRRASNAPPSKRRGTLSRRGRPGTRSCCGWRGAGLMGINAVRDQVSTYVKANGWVNSNKEKRMVDFFLVIPFLSQPWAPISLSGCTFNF